MRKIWSKFIWIFIVLNLFYKRFYYFQRFDSKKYSTSPLRHRFLWLKICGLKKRTSLFFLPINHNHLLWLNDGVKGGKLFWVKPFKQVFFCNTKNVTNSLVCHPSFLSLIITWEFLKNKTFFWQYVLFWKVLIDYEVKCSFFTKHIDLFLCIGVYCKVSKEFWSKQL